MDFKYVIFEAFTSAFSNIWWMLIPASALLIFKTRTVKGYVGELFIRLIVRFRLPSNTYRSIHNVTLDSPDGTTQIDHVYVSPFGVFVVETKNMKGWIFGSEKDRQWTQNIYGKSYKFQNPIHQNYKHVKALESILDISTEAIHSVVVFTGTCSVKSSLPENVTRGIGLISYIRSFEEIQLSVEEVNNVVARIGSTRLKPTSTTHKAHVVSLKTRHENYRCPRCGSEMVKRTAKKGANTGKVFWGCSTYPVCRAVQNVA